MKSKILSLLSVALLSGLLFSCNLDTRPKGSIEVSEGFQTIQDAARLRRGEYSYFRNANYGTSMLFADIQADILTPIGSSTMYKWQPTLAEDYSIRDFWSTQYYAISQANAFLDHVDQIKVENEKEQKELNQYKGEVLLMRAVYYYNLALRYMSDYEPASAAKEKGLPLYQTYDPGSKLPRANMQETWSQIYKDATEAIKLLPAGGKAMPMYITGDYAQAVLARIALCMHKWDEAIKACDNIIPKYALANSVKDLNDLWTNDTGTEILMKPFISINEGAKSMDLSYIGYGATSQRYFPSYLPAQWVLDLYEPTDYRRSVYFMKQDIWSSNVKFPDIWLYNKTPGNPIYFTKEYSNYVHAPKLFMISEAYLIKAEAQAQSGKDEEAIKTLNILRQARGASVLPAGANAMEELKKERTREMIAEGGRLFDLKRWHMGFDRASSVQPNAIDAINREPGTIELSKKADDKMFVWEIPVNDLKANKLLVPNW